jgi:Mg-chelatase subunit ChlD
MNELTHLDLAFVVDTTGSMAPLLQAAQRHMIDLLRAVSAGAGTPPDLRLAVVEYRDHPPQDHTFVTRPHAFTAELGRAQKTIDGLKADGGGDGPEAVYDGLAAACDELAWREHSQRLAVLIGDAPPHGWHRAGDGFPDGCPCGRTADSVTALFEQKGVTLYAVGLTHGVETIFARLARYTGGEYFASHHPGAALEAVQALLGKEFGDLAFDRQVLEHCRADPAWTVDGLGTALASPRARLSASLSRLGRRGLLRGQDNLLASGQPG